MHKLSVLCTKVTQQQVNKDGEYNNFKSKRGVVWTADEVELLLRVTLDHKLTKYSDIMDVFQVQYPRDPTEKDFHHDANMASKTQVTA